jgi:DNA-binding NarL/FixJ family response regulator
MPTRLLIIDDHAIMREGLRRLLQANSNLEIVGEATDSEAGWVMAHTLQPDLVVMDIDMPGEGGIALTFRIKSHYPAIKIVVLTGHVDPKFANDALKAGASGYLLKTNGAAELQTAIDTVLDGKVFLCSATTTALVRGSTLADAQKPAAPKIELPEREMQVLQFVVQGLRNKEIAAKLDLNVKTVETYRSRIMKRLNCGSPAELVRYAIRKGLAEL